MQKEQVREKALAFMQPIKAYFQDGKVGNKEIPLVAIGADKENYYGFTRKGRPLVMGVIHGRFVASGKKGNWSKIFEMVDHEKVDEEVSAYLEEHGIVHPYATPVPVDPKLRKLAGAVFDQFVGVTIDAVVDSKPEEGALTKAVSEALEGKCEEVAHAIVEAVQEVQTVAVVAPEAEPKKFENPIAEDSDFAWVRDNRAPTIEEKLSIFGGGLR